MRFWLLGLGMVAACDVAPRPINLERSFIETPQEGYQVFADTIIASNTARQIGEGCADFEFDEAAKNRQMQFFEAEMERLAVEDPVTFDGIVRRLGASVTAEEVIANGFDGLTSSQIDTAFLLKNAGLTVDIGSRAVGMVVRSGLRDDCEDARREVSQGTMAGSFLKSVPKIIASGQTAPVPMPEFAPEDPVLTVSPQVLQGVN